MDPASISLLVALEFVEPAVLSLGVFEFLVHVGAEPDPEILPCFSGQAACACQFEAHNIYEAQVGLVVAGVDHDVLRRGLLLLLFGCVSEKTVVVRVVRLLDGLLCLQLSELDQVIFKWR